jgi:AcrR family transcriptional regulator
MSLSSIPSTSKGRATWRRILDAGATEFARAGIAGARMERIIAGAEANKAQLYAYFGSKEGLFDAVVADQVDSSIDAVPFDDVDLPGWVVSLYDQNLQHPELARLIAWTRLERRPTGLWFDSSQHEPKLAAIAKLQAEGRVRVGEPADLLILLIGMASAWSPSSSVYTATLEEPAAAHDRRRALLLDSVERAIAP